MSVKHPEDQMSHDFAGASEVDEAPTELIFQTPVQLLGRAANDRRSRSGRRRAGPTHAELAQFLVSHDRALLLSRNVHSNPAHGPWHLRYPQTT